MTESEWRWKPSQGRGVLVALRNRLSERKRELLDSEAYSRVHNGDPEMTDAELADFLREQLGNPFRPYRFEPAWRTETVLALASAIEAEHAFDRMPILADSLEEAGCDERAMLDHLRGSGPHSRGCWVLDLILDREPELFSQPPLDSTPRRMKLGPFTPPADGMA